MPLETGSRLGPYEVTGPLGAGGMGEVYRARDTRLGRDVAIKILPQAFAGDAERRARFEREASVLASLNHPCIAVVHGVEDDPASAADAASGSRPAALVMELVDGPTLAERLGRGPLPIEESFGIAKQIARALEAAHEHDIVHRDLKPANIKVRPDGAVKVLDFGLAKALAPVGDAADGTPATVTALTQAGRPLGTPAYMAPEQARGAPVDRSADLWAFGCVLFEMLTGEPAFPGESTTDIVAAVLKSEPDWAKLPPETSPAVRMLLRQALRKQARERLGDARSARLMLEVALEGADAPSAAAGLASPLRRNAAWIAAAVAVAAAGSFLAGRFVSAPAADGSARVPRSTPEETMATHSYIVSPEGTTFHGGEPLPIQAISPDGRTLAFVATDDAGGRLIWVRPLAAPVARPLNGTEAATGLFWSPDSEHLAFAAPPDLVRRVSVATGAVQTIGRAAEVRGGTWGSRDTILMGTVTTGIRLFPAGGGSPLEVTEHASGETLHFYPSFLPDGEHFLYAIDDPRGLYIGSTAVPPGEQGRQALLSEFVNVQYVPDPAGNGGHLLFVRDGTLYAQPFDVTTRSLMREPAPLRSGIGETTAQGPAQFSASRNGVLTTIPSNPGTLAVVTREGERLRWAGDPGSYITARPSPDGRNVVFLRADPTGAVFDLWLMDLDRGAPRRFTNHQANAPFLAWSPDGSEIAYSSNHETPQGQEDVFNVYTRSLDGGEATAIPPSNDRWQFVSDWTNEGIIYRERASTAEEHIYLWPTGGGEPVPLVTSPFLNYGATLSPDGRWLAFVSDESGRDEIYVQAFPTARGKERITTSGGTSPVWSSSGGELFFATLEGRLMSATVRASGDRFAWDSPRPLFQLRALGAFRGASIWRPIDEDRFLVLRSATQRRNIELTLNWPSLLE